MASKSTQNDTPANDELDAILNGTYAGNDIFNTGNVDQPSGTTIPRKAPGDISSLGLDEEIKVTKTQRRPIPKLDLPRLISGSGVPKLQKISKERLRFKGKGHEYGDVAQMLNMYQLWLDDLYPRAKFADGLAMIEKLGHTKRLQMLRKMWIDEDKPRPSRDDSDEDEVEVEVEGAKGGIEDKAPNGIAGQGPLLTNKEASDDASDERAMAPHMPADDELDAMLAEMVASDAAKPSTGSIVHAEEMDRDDPYADDMAAMEGLW